MGEPAWNDVRRFLLREARLLDAGRLDAWLETVPADDITYRIPTRTTQEKGTASEFSDESFHLREDAESLAMRVARLENEYAWSTNPPSRTRRFVSNIAVTDPDTLSVTDYLLFVRYTRDSVTPTVLSARREHELRSTDDGLELVARQVLLDSTALGLDWLPIL